nr:hypothetical protein GCM10020093_021990 [Planobispora longispora]
MLLLSTVGPRVSELVRANVEDFFTNDGVRYWRIFGKGGRTRDVPLPGDVARMLEVYLTRGRQESADKALLLSWRGGWPGATCRRSSTGCSGRSIRSGGAR